MKGETAMKRLYMKPAAEVIELKQIEQLLSESGVRDVAGDPTNNGLPSTVGETDENNNGYGHGVGDPSNPIGGGNRAKGVNLWDEWD